MDKVVENIVIDSRNRNTVTHPSANRYVIDLDTPIKNVVSVELTYAIYPKICTEFYTTLFIEEIDSNVHTNNHFHKGAFTQLPLLKHINEYKSSKYSSKVTLQKPISKLRKLTIAFKTNRGNPQPMGEHFLRFEVTHIVYSGEIEFDAFSKNRHLVGGQNTESQLNPLVIMGLAPNFTLEELNDGYKRKKKEINDNGGSEADLRVIKFAASLLKNYLKSPTQN